MNCDSIKSLLLSFRSFIYGDVLASIGVLSASVGLFRDSSVSRDPSRAKLIANLRVALARAKEALSVNFVPAVA